MNRIKWCMYMILAFSIWTSEVVLGLAYYNYPKCQTHNQPPFQIWLIVNGLIGILTQISILILKYTTIKKMINLIFPFSMICCQIILFFLNIYDCDGLPDEMVFIKVYAMLFQVVIVLVELYSICIVYPNENINNNRIYEIDQYREII